MDKKILRADIVWLISNYKELTYPQACYLSSITWDYHKIVAKELWIDMAKSWFVQLTEKDQRQQLLRTLVDLIKDAKEVGQEPYFGIYVDIFKSFLE